MTPSPEQEMPQDLRAIDEVLTEVTAAPVEAPPWSAVVDRIAAVPERGRRLKIGWSAIIAGGVVAATVGISGAVSEPVRETVFEPVANLLPWVDDDPEPLLPVDGDDQEPAPSSDPSADRPASDESESDQRPADTGDRDSVPSRTTVAPDRRPDGADTDTDTPADRVSTDRPADAEELTPEQIERLRREAAEEERRRLAARRQEQRDAATSTTTTVGVDRSGDEAPTPTRG